MSKHRTFQFQRSEFSDQKWESILALHEQFFSGGSDSRVATSSHWVKLSEHQRVSITEDEILLSGYGFGDYENSANLSIFRKFANVPMTLSSKAALLLIPRRIRRAVQSVASLTSRPINPDFVRLANSLKMITLIIPEFGGMKTIAIIGDGFGTLGSILMFINPKSTVLQVNLGRQLLFDYLFMLKVHPHRTHKVLNSLSEIEEGSVNYLPAELVSSLEAGIDLFISSESFQEMNLNVIENYFQLMRFQGESTYLYSANRVSKALPDGEIIEIEKYPWSIDDVHLSIHSHWWLNWGIKRRPPFVFKMDGRIEERITLIHK